LIFVVLKQESTKEAPTSEHVMVERMFAGEEKQSLERLKEETRVAKELQLTPVWPVKSEPTTSGATATTTPVATNDIVNGRRDSPSEDLKLTPKVFLDTNLSGVCFSILFLTFLIKLFNRWRC
jgi:hypothetical protein